MAILEIGGSASVHFCDNSVSASWLSEGHMRSMPRSMGRFYAEAVFLIVNFTFDVPFHFVFIQYQSDGYRNRSDLLIGIRNQKIYKKMRLFFCSF